jgi:hypothetical protein
MAGGDRSRAGHAVFFRKCAGLPMARILATNSEATPGVGMTAKMLAAGMGGLDSIEAGIRLVEADISIRAVGPGVAGLTCWAR